MNMKKLAILPQGRLFRPAGGGNGDLTLNSRFWFLCIVSLIQVPASQRT
ncbi:hypothetical protein HMPREF1326_02847 [Akkermansia sp. KLE1605]|nr:hypothetical protein HMPREF1326_02847 [Akkermansia sp. KLE1605]